LEDQESETDEDETEDLATSVGDDETLVDVISALIGGSHVGEGGNSHTNVACDDRSEATNEEGNRCVELTQFNFSTKSNKNCENNEENAEEDIFLL
jgi:hypothetical protein